MAEHPYSVGDRVLVSRDLSGEEHVEGLVVDVALSAFASGQLAASQAVGSGQLTWVAAGGEEACAECVANGSAGPVLPGNEFVSGHRHPPVHAGCRCAITSTSV